MTIKSVAVAASLFLSLCGTAAHANLVTNGNFEATTYTANSQFGTGFGGQGVTGWTGNGGYDLYFFGGTATTVSANSQYGGTKEKLYGPASGTVGGNFVALDGDTNVRGSISQLITGLIVGKTYELSFDWGAGQIQSRTGATTEQLSVSLGGETHTTAVVSNASQSFSGWVHQTLTYTATGAQETLSFLSIGTPSGLPPIATLDGVSLVDVPEPMTLSLLGAGLIGFAAIRRRRA